jgi:hypothetical protein
MYASPFLLFGIRTLLCISLRYENLRSDDFRRAFPRVIRSLALSPIPRERYGAIIKETNFLNRAD